MKEITFLKRNRERFKALEKETQEVTSLDSRGLARKFLQLTDDLSYARTFFPQSKTSEYLNYLSSKYFYDIVKSKKVSGNSIGKFYKTTFPLAVYQLRKYILMSFVLFSFFTIMGIFTQINDNEFANLVLGEDYVKMTKSNIKNGDPMGVYKDSKPLEMFMQIGLNNVWVMFRGFAGGILLGYGTLMSLFYNGIMLGTFQYFCAEQGAFFSSLSTIWIHGTLEIWCCIISSGCGLALGWSIIFPGRLSRMENLKKNGIQTGRVIIGVFPIIILAAFLESFVTRHYQFNVVFNWVIIIASGSFIYWYFFIYPKQTYLDVQMKRKFKYNIITEEDIF